MAKRKSTHGDESSTDTTRRRSTRLKSTVNSAQDAAEVNTIAARPEPKQRNKQQPKLAKSGPAKKNAPEETAPIVSDGR